MKFKFLGGHPALDFINTVGGRTHTSATRYTVDRERLETQQDLEDFWSAAALPPLSKRQRSCRTPNAIEFREALYRIFLAAIANRRPDAKDIALLNRTLTAPQLTFKEGTATLTTDDPLAFIARSAAELLTSPEISRVRACGGESCGWLFLDTSRNRSRQWCDMRDCGNIAKVRRFRERRRPAG